MISRKWVYRLLLAGIIAFIILVIVIATTLYSIRRNADAKRQAAISHLTIHQESLVQDAQTLFKRLSQADHNHTSLFQIKSADVPPSLAIPQLRFAEVSATHVNLILYTSPDVQSGYRVWLTPDRHGYEDESTPLPCVTRFSFCDDYPESATNQL